MIQELHTGISDIRLLSGEKGLHVEVKTAGIWYEVIFEPDRNGSIDHFVTAEEIRRLYLEEKAIKDFTQGEVQ